MKDAAKKHVLTTRRRKSSPWRSKIAKLKHGKAPGIDGIPAEVYQHGGSALLRRLHDLFTKCWELGVLPQDPKDATIVSLYKNQRSQIRLF